MLKVERFVSPRGAVHNGDYSPEPDESGMTGAVSIDTLRYRTASLVLGEPGAGKSTALISLEESASDEGWEVQRVDLRDCFTINDLEEAFGQVSGRPGREDGFRLLLLDSVDETPGLIRNYVRFLGTRLSRILDQGWRVIAVCRTAESVVALDALFESLDEGAVHVLLPLRRSDVAAIADHYGIEADGFQDALVRRRLDSLAAVPFTLALLCQVYSADGAFPESRAEVFERAISLILATDAVEGYFPTPSSGQLAPLRRRLSAERLAAFAAFADSGGYALFNVGEPSSGTLTERLVGVEKEGETEVEINNDDLQVLLRGPLFSDSGSNERHFAHRRLRDYLAAKYLARKGLERSQMASLLTVGDSSAIPPQMVDVATWLVALDPAAHSWLVDSDPLSLVRNKIGEDVPALRPRLLDELLARADESDRILSWRDDLSGLEHPGMEKRLARIAEFSESEQAVALRVLRDSYVDGLEDQVRALIEDPKHPGRIRELAVDVLETRPLLLDSLNMTSVDFFASDEHAQLRGDLLRALWPNYISTADMVALLVEQPKNYFGSYASFLIGLEQGMDLELAEAIVIWRVSSGDSSEETDAPRSTRRGLRSLVDVAVGVAMTIEKPGNDLVAGIEKIFAKRLAKYRDKLPFDSDTANRATLHAVAAGLVQRCAREDCQWFTLLSATDLSGRRLLDRRDIDWMREEAIEASTDTERKIWSRLIDRQLDFEVAEDLEWAWGLRGGPLWNDFRHRFDAIELNSAEAVSARENWRHVRMQDEAPSERGMPLDEYLSGAREILIDARTNIEKLFWLPRWLDVDLAARRYEPNGPDLVKLPDWNLLRDEEREEVMHLASRYLEAAPNFLPEAAEAGTVYWHLRAAYRFLHTLLVNRPSLIGGIDSLAWGRLTLAILEYPTYGEDEGVGPIRKRALRLAQSKAPEMFEGSVSAYLKQIGPSSGDRSALRDLKGLLSDSHTDALRDAIVAESFHRHALLELLFDLDVDQAVIWLGSRVFVSTDVSEVSHLLSALMGSEATRGYGLLKEFIERRDDIRSEVLLDIAARERHGQRKIHEVEPEIRVALFEDLSELFPRGDESFESGVHTVTPREDLAQWRQSLLYSVVNGGTHEGVRAVTDLTKRRPSQELEWALSTAREAYRVNGWSPLTIDELRAVVGKTGARLARSSDDVLGIVVQSLAEIQDWIGGETPQAFSLWNEGSSGLVPKDENRISDWYCHALRVIMRRSGFIINREVEVKNTYGKGVGHRQDIRVEVIDPESGDHLVTVVEVKGIWNSGVRTNLVSQLAEDYLAANGLSHGIYLVVCFSPQEGMTTSKTNAINRNARDLLPHLQQQAASLVPLKVVPIVHNADIP